MIALPPRYATIKKLLNGGGMSDTALCEDAHLRRPVVVKGLKPGIEKHRLMDELAALSAIRSKHVVQVLDVIYDGKDIVGLVEEYIDGPDLSALPVGHSASDASKLLFSIASGVADVHGHGRLHRDLKPENMKFDSGGVLKLFDFGLAKLVADAKTGKLFYSQGYAAPEIFVPDAQGRHHFTAAVDIFSIGATAWWLLNGGNLPMQLKHIPPLLPCVDFSMAPCALPHNVSSLLNRCLDAVPGNRPTASELRDELAKQLLFGRHRMLITYGGAEHVLDLNRKSVTLEEGGDGVTIQYDGFDFRISAITGHVRRNNMAVHPGDILTGASVIVLGSPFGNRYRVSLTADVSHPEVTS